jgi:hypothetical protein
LRVRDGRVQKKNNWLPDQKDYFARRQDEIRLDRKQPGAGWRHVVTIPQLRRFLELLPDWDDIAVGLDAIVLDCGRSDAMGWYSPGVVALCAWPAHSGFWHESDKAWLDENAPILTRLEVQTEEIDGRHGILWTEEQARAFMLLDVLPHELGHHRDLHAVAAHQRAASLTPSPTRARYSRRSGQRTSSGSAFDQPTAPGCMELGSAGV